MESSSLWTPIYRKVSNFGNFVSIYIYIYRIHRWKSFNFPEVISQMGFWSIPGMDGSGIQAQSELSLIERRAGGGRKRRRIVKLDQASIRITISRNGNVSMRPWFILISLIHTATSIPISLSLLPRRTKKKRIIARGERERENSALRIEYIGYMEYKHEWISFGGFWKRGWSGGWRSGLINQAVDFMVSPLFFIREVCLFVAKLAENFSFFSLSFFFLYRAWRNGKIRAIKRN